jgi:hypothetical protein
VQLAVVNSSKADDRDLAFFCEAVNRQVIDAAELWDVPTNVMVFHSSADNLPQSNARIIEIVDDMDLPGALGYHANRFGLAYGKCLNHDGLSTTLSHEGLEMLVDPFCNEWRRMGVERRVALEIADPVQADTYPILSTLFGETRQIMVSNYVLPRWFDPAAPGGFDAMAKLAAPFSMSPGGYMIVRDWTGEVTHEFAKARVRVADDWARLALGGKLLTAGSRIAQRLR